MKIDTSAFDEPIEQEVPTIDTSAFDEVEPQPTLETIPAQEAEPVEISNVITPTGGAIYKGTKAISQTIPESFLKAGEIAAQKIGGLSPEQVEYYKQNYKAMEASGMTPEAIQDVMQKLEKTFKEKNLAATMAVSEGERLAPVQLTREVAKEAVGKSIPSLMTPIQTKEEPFQKVLKQRMDDDRLREAQRLENLLKQKEETFVKIKDYAQTQAEIAGQKAVEEARKANKKISLTSTRIDEKAAYNEAFDKALVEAKVKEEELLQNLQRQTESEVTKGFQNLGKDKTAEYTKQLVEEYQTPLAKEYPSVKGMEKSQKVNPEVIDKLLNDLTDISSRKGREAFDFLRELRSKGWKESGIDSEVAAAIAEKLREQLAPEGTSANKQFKEAHKLLNELEVAEQQGFIQRISGEVDTKTLEGKISKFSPESVKIGQEEQQFIKRVMNPSAKDLQNVDIQEGRKIFERLVNDPQLLEEVKQAAIKMDLLDPSKAAKFGATDAFRIMIGTGLGQFGPVIGYEAVKGLKTPTGAYKAATFGSRLLENIPQSIKTLGKAVGQALPILGAGVGGYMGYQEAKQEGLPEWAAIPYAGFEAISPIPVSPLQAKKFLEQSSNIDYSSETLRRMERGEVVPKEKQVSIYKGTLKADNPAEIASVAQALQSGQDKASQEYGRVLSQIVDAPASQKEAILFGLNQQPAFRDLVRKLKDEQKTDEETPLMLKGPA
jgi:hypothetical protein